MSLFSITCTTCKSRLKVRDQTAIGQILACPKCGGMVMVKAPPAFQEAGEQRSDIPTATELSTPLGPKFNQTLDSSAFDVVDELLSDAPPKMQQPLPAETPAAAMPAAGKPRFVGGPKAARQPAMPTQPASVPPPPPEPPPAQPASPAEPAAPRRSGLRQWLFIAASVGLGIALAFGAVLATILVLRGSRGPIRPHKIASSEPPAAPVTPITEKEEAPSPSPGEVGSETVTAVATPEAPAEPSPEASPPVEPPAAPPVDPVGIVKAPAASQPAPPAAASELAKFDQLLAGGSDDPLAQPTAPAPPATPPDSDSGPVKPLAPRPLARDVDVGKRLADPLVSIETAGTPLADFVQLISDLSTIPITLELPLTPASVESPVVVKLANTTVGAALAEALRPLRLEYVAGEGQLLVRRVEPQKFEPVSHSVKDLTGGDDSQLAELAELLRSTVEPEAWGEEAGGSLEADAATASLVLIQRRAIELEALVGIEKLRAARHPPLPHVLKLDPALFATTTRCSRAAANLEKTVSFNFSQSTRLLTILERLGEATDTRIVVDWQDVAAGGWNPAAEAKLLVNGKTLAEALDALLDPLDLAWRVIDARTLQVVTPARLASQGELELYPVDALVTDAHGEALLSRVRAALAKPLLGKGSGEVRFDEHSQCLLAWLPQPHQQALELLLAQWKADSRTDKPATE